MKIRKDKKEPPTCSWCGTKLRGRRVCPRGAACAKEQAEHDTLMERLAK